MESLIEMLFKGTSVGTYQMMVDYVSSVAKIENSEVGFIAAMYNAVVPAAYGLLIAFSLYAILEKVIQHGEDITVYTILPIFVRIGLCIALFSASDLLIGSLAKLSNLLYESASTAITEGLSVDTIFDPNSITNGWSFVAKVYTLAWSGFIGLLSRAGAIIIITISAMITKAEFIVRLGLLPLGIANICGHEHRGGVRYIKQLIANAFFMLVIIIEIYIVGIIFSNLIIENSILDGIMGFFVNFFLTTIVGPFSACFAVMSSKEAIKRALG